MEDLFSPPQGAWLYIALDLGANRRTKLGVTHVNINARTGRTTANPGILPVIHLPLDGLDATQVEQHLLWKVDFPNELHRASGRRSEWFVCTPGELLNSIKADYVNCFANMHQLFNDDVLNRLYEIAVMPVVDQRLLCRLSERASSSNEVERYIAAVNGVRREIGLAELTESQLYA